MRRWTPIPPDSVVELKRNKETGIGYQVVSVTLQDGRHFDQAVASEGCIIQVADTKMCRLHLMKLRP